MLYFHKLLPILFLPIGLMLIFVTAGLILKKRLLIISGVLLLLVFSLPVTGDSLMRMVTRDYSRKTVASMPRADVIVVLSGMISTVDGAPLGEWNDAADRFEGGIELYRAGKAPLIVFTGGWLPWKPDHLPEGEVLAKRAVVAGVPPEAVRVIGMVQNTAEEALSIAGMLNADRRSRKTVILVTSANHMPRSVMLFRNRGLQVIPYPVDFQEAMYPRLNILSFLPQAEALWRSERAMRELIGIVYYSIVH
jgi:uncharacterized SAM-binding protein YcdF (DUF218 family)